MKLQSLIGEFEVPVTRLNQYRELNALRVDKLFAYFLYGCFGLSVILGYQKGTFLIGLIGCSSILLTYIITRRFIRETYQNRILYVLYVAAMAALLTWQTKSFASFPLFFAIGALVFVFYEKYTLIALYFAAGYAYIIAMLIDFEESRLYQRLIFMPDDTWANAFWLFILFSCYGAVCSMFVSYLTKQTEIEAGKDFFLKERLNIEANTVLARKIAQSDFASEYRLIEGDVLGQALLEMRDRLKELNEIDQLQKWADKGNIIINNIFITSRSLNELTELLINNIVRYVNAQQGFLYLLADDKSTLHLQAHYAVDQPESLRFSIDISDGAVGEAAAKNKMIVIETTHDPYYTIGSGLGETMPKCMVYIPITLLNEVLGVLQISSLHILQPHQIGFLEKTCESLGATINRFLANEKTQKLLAESNRINDELHTKEKLYTQQMEMLLTASEGLERENLQLQEQLASLRAAYAALHTSGNTAKEAQQRISEQEYEQQPDDIPTQGNEED